MKTLPLLPAVLALTLAACATPRLETGPGGRESVSAAAPGESVPYSDADAAEDAATPFGARNVETYGYAPGGAFRRGERALCPFGDPVLQRDDEGETEIVERSGYKVLHSSSYKTPLWVCERYTEASLESVYDRAGLTFDADPELSGDKAVPSDYEGIRRLNIDTGHMAPAEAHSATEEAIIDTFYLSNAVPQNATLNRGKWARVEACTRATTPEDGVLWVVSGPIFKPRNDGMPRHIGDRVRVPSHVWKVAVRQQSNGELSAWAVLFPNNASVKGTTYAQYKASVDEIEDLAGLDLMPRMPDGRESALESAKAPYPCND